MFFTKRIGGEKYVRENVLELWSRSISRVAPASKGCGLVIFQHEGNLGVGEYPAINALTGKESVIVTAELPGINPDKLNIAVQNDTLAISGSRDIEALKEGEVYHRQERSHGQSSRTIKLPFNANADKIDASYKKGVLSITLHRSEVDKPKKIVIKSE
jgi:HSP20 family protein